MNTKGTLQRLEDDGTETLGQLTLQRSDTRAFFTCKTAELPWLDNDPVTSCYPPGTYRVVRRTSPAYGLHWHVLVPGRAYRLIHIGNFATGKKKDTKGCTLVGAKFADLNGDGHLDVSSSTATMQKLNAYLTGIKEFTLHVLAPPVA